IDVGPRGEYVRVTTVQKPFSYIVPANSFGTKEELWALDGTVVTELSSRPLNDGVRTGAGGGPFGRGDDNSDGMRNVTWRPDGAGLSSLQQEAAPDSTAADSTAADTAAAPAGRNGRASSRRKDRVMLWAPPFDESSRSVVY